MVVKVKDYDVRGRVLSTNLWVDNEGRTWKFEFGIGVGFYEPITVYVNGEKFFEEHVQTVGNYNLVYLFHGTISLGRIVEDNTVFVDYKNNKYFF